VDGIDLPVKILWIIVPVHLGRRTHNELRQVDPVEIRGVFDIKERAEPLFT
jgi:hypothetical protein